MWTKVVFPSWEPPIQKLPATGEIRSGRLDWPDHAPELLAEGRFLALDVDLDHSGQISSAADVQIEFGRETVRVFSLLGYWEWPYPRGYLIALQPHRPGAAVGRVGAGIAGHRRRAVTAIGFLLSWWLLATLYFLPVWLLGFFANRDLNFRQSWKLSGAALMPGALLMAAGILLYGIGVLNLVSFGFIFGAHFVLGWIYLFVSLLFRAAGARSRSTRAIRSARRAGCAHELHALR